VTVGGATGSESAAGEYIKPTVSALSGCANLMILKVSILTVATYVPSMALVVISAVWETYAAHRIV